MPIGIQRFNAQRPQPSSQIIFIKPLPGPAKKYAQDFLERIAAICHPIMKANHLSIMTLEEHEPNPEFIGRNFNAGEIIQLVLKAPYTGHWLSFRSVQMVMMHEMAHCVQMNHSGAFWKVNNQFKGELKELWRKGYTGDGLWGRGQTLLSGEYHTGTSMDSESLPASLCGGTFRSSRRGKRKRGAEKPTETYAERQQKRIKKKFGINGQALGDDEGTKMKLENGKKPKGKPRVAGSTRGRELRAAAALARFDQVKEERTEEEEEEEDLFGESETESDVEGVEDGNEAVDLDGCQIRDGKGRGMVKVCEDEDQDDFNVKREIEELQQLNQFPPSPRSEIPPVPSHRPREAVRQTIVSASVNAPHINLYDIPQYVEKEDIKVPAKPKINIHRKPTPSTEPVQARSNQIPASESSKPPNLSNHTTQDNPNNNISTPPSAEREQDQTSTQPPISNPPYPPNPPANIPQPTFQTCPICSMTNDPSSLLCIACSHVLDTKKVTRYWRCQRDACQGSQYINAADCGICGVCGGRKSGRGSWRIDKRFMNHDDE